MILKQINILRAENYRFSGHQKEQTQSSWRGYISRNLESALEEVLKTPYEDIYDIANIVKYART